MGTRLLQIVTFTNVAAAATVVLPHTLNIAGTPVTPDFIAGDQLDFSISATSATVTVTNDGAAPATIHVWLERKHSEIRELGGGITNMTPQPFAISPGGGGGTTYVPPYVDLRLPPYNVVADDTSAAASNTLGINTAIVDFDGTDASLVLPDGTIYVERANGTDNWCILFAAGTTRVQLIGQGMYSTQIAEYAVGDGGGSFTLLMNETVECAAHDFGIYQDMITNPDPIQDNHLIGVTNLGVGTQKDTQIWNVLFGKSIGDQLRFLGDTTVIEDVNVHDLVMHGAGTVTSTPPNGRVGSRSCISFQRNYRRIRIDNVFMDGAQNSCFDHEPTGVPTAMDGLHASNIWIDNRVAGVTEAAASYGGVSAGVKATNGLLENFNVIGGTFNCLQTSGLTVKGMSIVAPGVLPGNAAASLFLVRQTNDNLVIEDTTVERLGGTAGLCFDIENQGTRTTLRGCRVNQATASNPVTTDLTNNLTITDMAINYSGGSPTAHQAINVKAISGTSNDPYIRGVRVTSTAKMEAAIRFDTRTGQTMSRIQVYDVKSAGSALFGVYYSATAGTIDLTPEMSGINNGSDPVWKQTNAADAPVTTMFPIISGNRGDVCVHVSEATPVAALVAIQGCQCIFKNGDTTGLFWKQTAITSAGWVAVTIP